MVAQRSTRASAQTPAGAAHPSKGRAPPCLGHCTGSSLPGDRTERPFRRVVAGCSEGGSMASRCRSGLASCHCRGQAMAQSGVFVDDGGIWSNCADEQAVETASDLVISTSIDLPSSAMGCGTWPRYCKRHVPHLVRRRVVKPTNELTISRLWTFMGFFFFSMGAFVLSMGVLPLPS
jgi:hypothetical protein